ncbi:MAG: hypothetical protein N3I86_15610 [Verrucomicrobiae bacterium]|nr:hypothetical protein [Verrucomicrobiae bacterium]
MSTQEILAELEKLTPEELCRVKAKLEELIPQPGRPQQAARDVLLEFAGKAQELPSDLAENHDHYLYGTPRRTL